MKVFLIKPRQKVIEEVDYFGKIEEIYAHIGNGCTTFTTIVMNHRRDFLYIDANAREANAKNYNLALDNFQHKRYNGLLVGNALVLGHDENGDSQEPSMMIGDLRNEIIWRQ